MPLPSTADTLSINFRPGEDFRDYPTQSQSFFTFGDYRLERSFNSAVISGTPRNIRFDGYESYDSLNVTGYTRPNNVFVSSRELNLEKKKPGSYTYFATFKVEVALAIDNVLKTFPYAIMAKGAFPFGLSIYDYTAVTSASTPYSQFKIPLSALTNQGDIVLNSGTSFTSRSLMTNTQDFVLQLSASTFFQRPEHKIRNYTFSSGTYIEFQVEGIFLTGQTSGTSNAALWIRPNEKILEDYYGSITPLEYHILKNGSFKLANPEFDDGSYIERTHLWPRTIDGFNPDTQGTTYDDFSEDILYISEQIDLDKTDMMLRTMIPENFLDLDSETNIYSKTVQSYAHQFDQIKRYIDGMAFAHTVTYNGENSVPDKFIMKLSQLLGFRLKSGFDELDLFEYLASSVDESGETKKSYDLMLWRRILVNIIWLLKRKGTRDALMFIFKLIGAPDCMIRLHEYVYDIKQAVTSGNTGNILTTELSNKVNANGYINYESSQYVFQEGGQGRGNGQKYIYQWAPEFEPIRRIDNKKTYTGSSVNFGTENIVNTKELVVGLDPAQAVECNVFGYYKLSGTCWVWGSTNPYMFSNLTVPFEYALDDCDLIQPDSISGMTLSEWVDFVYKSNVNPRFHKVSDAQNGAFHYHELRKIYIHYYKNTTVFSDKLTIGKLEKFLQTIEMNFYNYAEQLIPATSILEAFGTIYRNTVFNRQKFVYKRGINDGSEFQVGLPEAPENNLTPVQVSNTVDDILHMASTPIIVNNTVDTTMQIGLLPVELDVEVVTAVVSEAGMFGIEVFVEDSGEQVVFTEG